MNREKFTDAMNALDDKYVNEAADYQRRSKKYGWIKWAAAAACLCLVVTAALLTRTGRTDRTYPVKQVIVTKPASESNAETAQIPHWEDMKIYEQYSEIVLNTVSYHARSGEVPQAQLGEKLAEIIARGWDEYADLAGEDANRYLNASVYEITGISSECAVAVRYEGCDTCYAAVNSYYRPETLGQFIDNLKLENTLVFNFVSYEYQKPSGEYADIRFENVDSAKIWEMLLSKPAAANEYDDLDFDRPKKIMDISVSLPILGYENISISLHENGYIATNILGTGKMFCIGEENTQALINYVLEECDGYEIVYVYEEEIVPE